MLQRGADARFMPGVWVFAGGVVEDADREAAVSLADGLPGIELDEVAHRICGARELGEEGGVEVEATGLLPWSRWVTPEPVPIRFDTRFYVTLAPSHCKPEPDLAEMDAVRWLAPSAALAEHEADELELSFPTIKHLEALVTLPDAAAVLASAAEREVTPVTPRVIGTTDEFRVVLPGEPGYDDA